MISRSGVIVIKDGKAWGFRPAGENTVQHDWVDIDGAYIFDPEKVKVPEDMLDARDLRIPEMKGAVVIPAMRQVCTIIPGMTDSSVSYEKNEDVNSLRSLVANLLDKIGKIRHMCAGDKRPNWHDDQAVYHTRGRILDLTEDSHQNLRYLEHAIDEQLREKLIKQLQESLPDVELTEEGIVPIFKFVDQKKSRVVDFAELLNFIRFGGVTSHKWNLDPLPNKTVEEQMAEVPYHSV